MIRTTNPIGLAALVTFAHVSAIKKGEPDPEQEMNRRDGACLQR
jgi:hypothetical protein